MKKQRNSGFLSQLIENTWSVDPLLAALGTDQSSESFISIGFRPLRKACRLEGVFGSHVQRIASLHVRVDRQYIYGFSFYSLFFKFQYHTISSVHTFLCITSCRIFSCEACVIEGFHVSEYPETVSYLWALIQTLIFFSCLISESNLRE